MPVTSPRSAKIITVINLKGGVGKTHLTWVLSGVCQEQKQRTLLIDTDTQANLTNSFIDPSDDKPGIEQLFNPAADRDVLPLVRRTAFEYLDIIPASSRLTRFDLADRAQWEDTGLHLSLVDPLADLRSAYDLVLIDCPPRLSVVSYAALCASDFVVVPLEAADWGAQGVVAVTAAVNEVRTKYNARLALLGYVVSRFKRARAYQQAYLKQLRQHFGPLAFDTVLPDRALFEAAVVDRIPLPQYAPHSTEAGIARELYREVRRRIVGATETRITRSRTGVHRARPVAA